MKNQSKQQDKQYKIPMAVTSETIRDFGIDPKDVTWRLIGNRKCRVVMVDATEEEYKAYLGPVWAEQKRQDRESRCLVPGKGGKLIRCPESNKCEKCSHASEVCREMNRPASLSFLVDEGAEPAAPGSFEDTVIYEALLEDLITRLNEIEPKYGEIFQLLYDGATQQEMADKLDMKQRTVSDYVKKIRAIVQPLVKDAFNR
ncbi:MAG: hypothetical protein LUC48_01115 [Clostridiales bacterium]|nr:hypothetical protein [Clostridiales bacterium]